MAGPFDRFVVLAGMRTGSNLLEESLNTVPGLHCHGEAFNPGFVGQPDQQELCGVTFEMREREPLRLLAALDAHTDGLAGFRFFHDHDPRVLDHCLADRRCAKVLLWRNPLESYVSRRIAAVTGQWRLRDMQHRRAARIRFDAGGFARHLAAQEGFRKQVLDGMRRTGQTPFCLDYAELGDAQLLAGLGRFLGLSAGTAPAPAGTLRKQNPGPLRDKVENPEEMAEAVAAMDPLALAGAARVEPRRGANLRGYVAPPSAPLLYLPIRCGMETEVQAWLAALDGARPEALQTGMTQKDLRAWRAGHPGHRSFTVVRHPLARAHAAFARRILATGPGSYPRIRAKLRRAYGVPLPEAAPGPGWDAAAHRAAFLAFLRFLEGNLAGQTGVRVDAAWASQTAVLQDMNARARPDMILRGESLRGELAALAGLVGHAPPAAPPTPAEDAPVPLAAIHDSELEAAARRAYPADYLELGYADWRPG